MNGLAVKERIVGAQGYTVGEADRRLRVEATADGIVTSVVADVAPKTEQAIADDQDWGASAEPDAEGWYTLTGALSGGKMRIEHLQATRLASDPIRPIREARIRELIKKGWDWGKVGTLLVSRRQDGRDVVIEGNHRLATMRRLELLRRPLRCEVYLNLTLEQEAVLWNAVEDRLRKTPLDQLGADVQARLPYALEITAALAAHGVSLRSGPGVPWPYVEAGRQVTRTHARFGMQRLSDAVGHAKRCWPHQTTAFDGHVLTALAWVRTKYGDALDAVRLDERLKTTTPRALRVAGSSHHKTLRNRHRDPLAQCIAAIILGLYNAGLRSNRLPDWEWER